MKPKILDKKNTYISKDVTFGKNVTIYPFNFLIGKTSIGDNTILYPSNYINSSQIGCNCEISYSHIEESVIDDESKVGPFSRLRPNNHIGKNCKIGNFVEIKNSILGDRTKASHLAYIGDAEIGENCNIGCGAIFVNYNGKTKSKTIVKDNCFIGSNANIIAPVKIDKGCYICAGTTLTQNTKSNDFVIGRTREIIKNNYAKKYFKEEK